MVELIICAGQSALHLALEIIVLFYLLHYIVPDPTPTYLTHDLQVTNFRCGVVLQYRGNPTNLASHLKSQHLQEWLTTCQRLIFLPTFLYDTIYVYMWHIFTCQGRQLAWQRGISHLLGIKTAGVTQCKQNGHVTHALFIGCILLHLVYH